MRSWNHILVLIILQIASLYGATSSNSSECLLLIEKLESHLPRAAHRFLDSKKQEPDRIERIDMTISRLQAEIHSNSPHKDSAKLQLKKIAAYLEREISSAQQKKITLLHEIDALKTKKIQYEIAGYLSTEGAVILRRYIDLCALRVAFFNQKIRSHEKFLTAIRLETTPENSDKKIWQALAGFLLASLVLAGLSVWTQP